MGKDLESIEVELDDETAKFVTKLSEWSGHTPATVLEVLIVLALVKEGVIE